MIAALSPADYNFDETLSTLRYASRAKAIKNKPIVNEDPKDALLKQYEDEITKLRQMLESMNSGKPQGGNHAKVMKRVSTFLQDKDIKMGVQGANEEESVEALMAKLN